MKKARKPAKNWIVEEKKLSGDWVMYASTARRATEREAQELANYLSYTDVGTEFRVRNIRRKPAKKSKRPKSGSIDLKMWSSEQWNAVRKVQASMRCYDIAQEIYKALFHEHEIDYSGEGDVGVEEPYALINCVVYPKADALIKAAICEVLSRYKIESK
jgi:hypothetical protein